MDSRTKGPLITIVGETASGKSALALDLARQFNGELICADSWTVYRGFDVGTAKPTIADREAVPHHLLDVADPIDGFSAAVFQRMAKVVIEDIIHRGRLPIMVGGTGLYIDSVLYDYSFLPQSDRRLRGELNELSLTALVKRAEDDGLDMTDIDLGNRRRVIRLIENNGLRPSKQEMRENTLVLGVQVSREDLKERMAKRIKIMVDLGLEDEVRRLSNLYGWDVEPMKGIGYREWREYFEGVQTYAETIDRILKASADLAKRQRMWFKRNQSIQWLSDRSNDEELLTTFLNKTN